MCTEYTHHNLSNDIQSVHNNEYIRLIILNCTRESMEDKNAVLNIHPCQRFLLTGPKTSHNQLIDHVSMLNFFIIKFLNATSLSFTILFTSFLYRMNI